MPLVLIGLSTHLFCHMMHKLISPQSQNHSQMMIIIWFLGEMPIFIIGCMHVTYLRFNMSTENLKKVDYIFTKTFMHYIVWIETDQHLRCHLVIFKFFLGQWSALSVSHDLLWIDGRKWALGCLLSDEICCYTQLLCWHVGHVHSADVVYELAKFS